MHYFVMFNIVSGAICSDGELADMISAFLCQLIALELWMPSYRLVSTVTVNCGLVRSHLGIADDDVSVLQASSFRRMLVRGVRFVETKVELLLQLVGFWVSTCHINHKDIEVLMQVVVMLCSHQEWKGEVVRREGRKCLWNLMRVVRVCDLPGLIQRMRVFLTASSI